MTFIDNTTVTENFIGYAPLFHPASALSTATNTDLLPSSYPLGTIGSEYYHGEIIDSKDFNLSTLLLSSSLQKPLYYEGSESNLFIDSAGTHTLYKNILSNKNFKNGTTVGANIGVSIGCSKSSSDSNITSKFRFIASLISKDGTKTAIGTSTWADMSSSSGRISSMLSTTGVVAGNGQRLFIELQIEASYVSTGGNITLSSGYYNYSSSEAYRAVTVNCSVED